MTRVRGCSLGQTSNDLDASDVSLVTRIQAVVCYRGDRMTGCWLVVLERESVKNAHVFTR